jgi:hypothetical protein
VIKTLIAQLNESWRVLRIAGGPPGCGPPFWSIERKIAGDWIGQATFRTPGMILWFLHGRAGTIDPDAAAILAALPARCDQDPRYRISPPPKKRPRPLREPAVVATPTEQPAPTGKRTALASQFLTWRDGKPHNSPVVRSQPETPPTPPPAEMARLAPRAATGNADAEAV